MKKKLVYVVIILVAFAIVTSLGSVLYHFILNDELNQASLAGEIPRIDACLDRGASINGSGMHGMKPLMSACKGGDIATVRHLIDKGANINGHNDSGSVLMWAIESGHIDIVRRLLEKGVDTKWTNCLGEDACAFAAEKGGKEMLELIK